MFPEYLIEHWLSQENTQTLAVMRANPGAWGLSFYSSMSAFSFNGDLQDLTLSAHQVKNLFRMWQF